MTVFQIIWQRSSASTRASAWSSSMGRACTRHLCRAGGCASGCPASCSCRFGSVNLHLALHSRQVPALASATNINVYCGCVPNLWCLPPSSAADVDLQVHDLSTSI